MMLLRRFAVAAVVLSVAATVPVSGPSSAAVPGLTFTQTGCEGYSDSVARLYTAALGRVPDKRGFAFWLDEYTSGRWQLPRMATFFVRSPEFLGVFGDLDRVEFVRRLYLNVLDREGEPDGVAFWSDQIAKGMDRGTVVLRFSESPENIERSGTSPPRLGPFNAGRSGPWECTPSAPDPRTTELWAVGDLTDCGGAEVDVAALLGRSTSEIMLLGDLAYPDGSEEDFSRCFDPLYAPMTSRILPVLGNHDYRTAGAVPYFRRFSDAAGRSDQGWYSLDRGRWQIIVLNSNCGEAGGCGPESEQYQWLDRELTRRPDACRLVGFHHPRWTSYERYDDNLGVAPLFGRLYAAGTDLILNGHVHGYERFAPLNPAGAVDSSRGIRSIIVGTGGRTLVPFDQVRAGSVVRNADTHRALRLQLSDVGYAFTFVPTAGGTFADQGSFTCVNG